MLHRFFPSVVVNWCVRNPLHLEDRQCLFVGRGVSDSLEGNCGAVPLEYRILDRYLLDSNFHFLGKIVETVIVD